MNVRIDSRAQLSAGTYETGHAEVSASANLVLVTLDSGGPSHRCESIYLTAEDAADLGDVLRAASRAVTRRRKGVP